MLVEQVCFELLDGLELDLVFRLGRLTALLPLVAAAFADGAGDPAHRPYHPVMVSVVEPHLRGLVVPVLPGLPLAGRGRQRREIADRLGAVPHFLGSEKPSMRAEFEISDTRGAGRRVGREGLGAGMGKARMKKP